MLDSGVFFGAPRLRILDTNYSGVLKTLYLPFPDRDGGVVVSDVLAKPIKQELLNGALRYRSGGVRHNVSLNYAIYDPKRICSSLGKTVGIQDDNVPELTQLYDLLSTYNNGRLAISPCSNVELWYRVACTSDLNREMIGFSAFQNVSLTFEGLDLYSTSSATTPIG